MALEEDCSWTELLPENPLFERLREEGCEQLENADLVCEIRGDLFVWSQANTALLTTNLKRLMAYPGEPQVYQTLFCTSSPLTPVLQLLPDGGASHVALRCRQSLGVMRLVRQRGQFGEFGGGQKTVNCKVTSVASDLFCIHRHSLTLVQVAWHPTQPGSLCLLTSDDTLRVYGLADPSVPLLLLPLSDSPPASCTLEDTVVAFSVWPDSVFFLRDTGDVYRTSLGGIAGGRASSPPLPMHPSAEDNYGSDACSLLVLPTSPRVLVIANSNGVIYHCIYIQEEKEEEGLGPAPSSGKLYVVEGVELEDVSAAEENQTRISLVADPVNPQRYFVVHASGVYLISLPWLTDVETCIAAGTELKSQVKPLVGTEPGVVSLQGMVVVSEPLLGCALVGLTSDGECITMTLPVSSESFLPHHLPPGDLPGSRHALSDPPSSGIENVIREILHSDEPAAPVNYCGRKDLSQQDCFSFLSQAIKRLRATYLLRQQRAKSELQHRIAVLCRQKEQQVEDLASLQVEVEEVGERTEELEDLTDQLTQRCKHLVHRVEQLVCRLSAQSPILSEAEVAMTRELEGLRGRLERLQGRLKEAQGRLELGVSSDYCHKPTLSSGQLATVMAALTESGQNIRALMQQVNSLSAMAPSH